MANTHCPYPLGRPGPRDGNGLPIWRVSYTGPEGNRELFLIGAWCPIAARAWAQRHGLQDVTIGRWRKGDSIIPSRKRHKRCVSYTSPASLIAARSAALGDAHGLFEAK